MLVELTGVSTHTYDRCGWVNARSVYHTHTHIICLRGRTNFVRRQVLRIEFSPSKERRSKGGSSGTGGSSGYCRMRVIFLARPQDPERCTPKGVPDFESVGAAWCTAEEVEQGLLPLRGQEPKTWLPYVARGGAVFPLSVLTREGAALDAALLEGGGGSGGGGKGL